MEPKSAGGEPVRSEADERQRSVGEFVKEAWGQALVAVSATEDEVQKILGRVTGWAEMGPDEARRFAAELTEKLRRERGELEDTLQAAVKKALTPLRLPDREEIGRLASRLDALEARIARLAEKRAR
jgi:polyhydroxyalkanoate synthesis regulator phasin